MANDKISNMASAAVAALTGTGAACEITTDFTGVPLTKNFLLRDLRTAIFAGGTGYTATDPITAGAASFTTGAFSGDVNVGAGKFVVTAATGAVAGTGNISITNNGGDPFVLVSDDASNYAYLRYDSPGNYGYIQSIAAGASTTFKINPAGGPVILGGALAITGALTGVTTLNMTTQPAFVAGDKYLVIDAAGNVHVSALGPAS